MPPNTLNLCEPHLILIHPVAFDWLRGHGVTYCLLIGSRTAPREERENHKARRRLSSWL